MSKRTVQNIQDDFNQLGSQLLQVELTIERYKEGLTKANSDKNKFLQKLVNLDNEFQKMKYADLQEAAKSAKPKEEGNKDEDPIKAALDAAPVSNTDQVAAG